MVLGKVEVKAVGVGIAVVKTMMMAINMIMPVPTTTDVAVVWGRRRNEFVSFGQQLVEGLGEGRFEDLLVVVEEMMGGCYRRVLVSAWRATAYRA